MKRTSIYLLIALFLTGITGCEEWLDVNQNPNDLTVSTKELVLTGVAKTYADRQQLGSGFALLGAWTGYFAHSGGWSGWNNVKSYRIIASDYNGFWTGPYPSDLTNLKYVEDQAMTDGNMAFVAVAKIMRAGTYQRIVDTYGDIPYSEAIRGFDGITTPKYDDAQEIYEDLVVELDWAITELRAILDDPGRISGETIGSEDIINDGDRLKWIRYANTLKLRILMQQTGMAGRTAYIQEKINTTLSEGFVARTTTGNITGNPGYEKNVNGKMNPLYAGYGKNHLGNFTSAHQQYSLNVFLHKLYTNYNDPRMEICWLPGVNSGDYTTPTKLGAPSDEMPHWNDKAILLAEGVYGPEDEDVAGGAGSGDVIVMSTMESSFLIAEAIQRGFFTEYAGLDAKGWFEEGVKESFRYYGQRAGLATADINTHITDYMDQAVDLVSFDDSPDKLKAIFYQKYIAGVGVYHFSTWSDYRRTGWPEPAYGLDHSMISVYFDIVAPQVPVRLAYPQREMDINTINVTDAITKTGYANDAMFIMNAKIFWNE